MKVLITGAGGQLGRALMARARDSGAVLGLTHERLDIADAAAVQTVLREFRPDVLINAAGFTRVDDAEKEPAAAQRANAAGPAVLAAGCRRASNRRQASSISTSSRFISRSPSFTFWARSESRSVTARTHREIATSTLPPIDKSFSRRSFSSDS